MNKPQPNDSRRDTLGDDDDDERWLWYFDDDFDGDEMMPVITKVW